MNDFTDGLTFADATDYDDGVYADDFEAPAVDYVAEDEFEAGDVEERLTTGEDYPEEAEARRAAEVGEAMFFFLHGLGGRGLYGAYGPTTDALDEDTESDALTE